MSTKPLMIGWKEYIDFPDWSLKHLKAKIDTGARTSALDVVSYRLIDGPDVTLVELHLALERKRPDRLRVLCVPFLGMVQVRNTGGCFEQRPVIETTISIGPVTKRVRLTLTDRSAMCFRMILGREALREDFIVDVSQKYLLQPRPTSGRETAAL